jgi:hypothetical protein
MSLGESRQVFDTNIDCTVSGVAERGGIMSFVPAVNGLCAYADATAVSGALVNPAGLLLDDVQAMNFFNHPEYRQRNVVPQGSVVGLLTEGEVLTDFVETATADGFSTGTYAPGDVLYMGDAGQVSRLQVLSIRIVVGRALSTVDGNGFLKARIEL